MKSRSTIMMSIATLSLAGAVWASEAETSAAAGSGRGRNGTAEATARYEGDQGMANARSRSGPVSLAHGVALGVDEEGMSFSASHAVSTPWGRAVATNFSITIGRDGQVAVSRSRVVSDGKKQRSASAGGQASSRHRNSQAGSWAAGQSDRRGKVETKVDARSYKPRRPWRRSVSRPRWKR